MTEMVLSHDQPPRALSATTVAALAALVLLAHALAAWTVLHLAQAPAVVAPAKVLEVSWIAPPQPDQPPPPQALPAAPRPPVPTPPAQRPRPVTPTPTPRPVAPLPAPTNVPVPVVAPQPAAAVTAAPQVAVAPAPTSVVAPAPAVPMQVATSALRYLEPLKPVYPRVSTDLCETGVVTLSILVNEWGAPVEVQVEKSSGYPRLDQAALTAMRAARFKPYTEGGQARPIRAHPTINFQLDC